MFVIRVVPRNFFSKEDIMKIIIFVDTVIWKNIVIQQKELEISVGYNPPFLNFRLRIQLEFNDTLRPIMQNTYFVI